MSGKIVITEQTIIRRRGVAELARRVGRSHTHVSRVLAGERKPGKELAKKLEALGVESEWGGE